MVSTIVKGTIFILEALVTDVSGNSVAGLSASFEIYNSASGALVSSGSLTDVGSGIYKSSVPFNTIGQFRVIYKFPDNYADGIESIIVEEERARQSVLDEALELVTRICGLSQENFRLKDVTYNAGGQMTSGKIRIYGSKSDTDNDVNHISEYEVDSQYDASGKLISYKVVKL